MRSSLATLPMVVADCGLRELFHRCGWSFPASVAGMVALFAGEPLHKYVLFVVSQVNVGVTTLATSGHSENVTDAIRAEALRISAK